MKHYQGLRRDSDSYHIFLSSRTGFWIHPSSTNITTDISSLDELGIDWFNMKVILV